MTEKSDRFISLIIFLVCLFITCRAVRGFDGFLDHSTQFVVLQLESSDLIARLRTLSEWYAFSQESNRTLIVSWAPTQLCNISLPSIFKSYPKRFKVLKDELPSGIFGQYFIQNATNLHEMSYIYVDESNNLLAKDNNISSLFQSNISVIHTTSTMTLRQYSESPCFLTRHLRSSMYTHMILSNHLYQKLSYIQNHVLNENMLISLHLGEVNRNLNSSSVYSYIDQIILITKAIWKYFMYEQELETTTNLISEEKVAHSTILSRFGDATKQIVDNGLPILVKYKKTVKKVLIQSWIRFLVATKDRQLTSQFISRFVDMSKQFSHKKWMTTMTVLKEHDLTSIVIDEISIEEEAANPLLVLMEEDSQEVVSGQPVGMQLQVLEWILTTRAAFIIDSIGEDFGSEANLARGLSMSSFPPSNQFYRDEKFSTSVREIPMLIIAPNNITLYQDYTEKFCGDPNAAIIENPENIAIKYSTQTRTHYSLGLLETFYEICSDKSLPWGLHGQTNNIFCMK